MQYMHTYNPFYMNQAKRRKKIDFSLRALSQVFKTRNLSLHQLIYSKIANLHVAHETLKVNLHRYKSQYDDVCSPNMTDRLSTHVQ